MGWIVDRLNDLTFVLDKCIYWLAEMVYQIFFKIAGFNIFGENTKVLDNITQRIYVILGLAMVFVVAFNLLNYIVDPDKVKDKSIGASAFIKDVIIALVIISALNPIFDKLYDFQTAILQENTIGNLILGGNVETDEQGKTDITAQGAAFMTSSIYTAFLKPSSTGEFADKTALDCQAEELDDYEMTNERTWKDYCKTYEYSKSSGITVFSGYYNDPNYDFTPFMTTIAGVALTIFMFTFCFQLAKRVGKLAIIQLVAPIPLVLEILPNKKGLRKKWFETLIKVYLDAFIYLVIVYFIVLLISLIPDAISGLALSGGLGLIACLILIFGLLMFGKEAPQLLFDLIGIKPTNIIKDSFGMAKTGAGMAAFLGGTAGSFVGSGIRNAVNTKGNVFQKVGSAFAGAGSSLGRNIVGARNVHSIRDANNLRRQTNQAVAQRRISRDAYAAAHGGNFRRAMLGHLGDAGMSIQKKAGAFLKGTAGNQERLTTVNNVAQSAKNGRIRPWTDNLYNSIKTRRDELRSTGYINDLTTFRNRYKHNASEEDFMNWMKGGQYSDINQFKNDFQQYKDKYNQNGSIEDFSNWMLEDHAKNNINFQDNFNTWKELENNPNATMEDFINDIRTNDYYSGLKDEYSEIFDSVEAKNKYANDMESIEATIAKEQHSALIDVQDSLNTQEQKIFDRDSSKLKLQAKETLLRLEDAGLQGVSYTDDNGTTKDNLYNDLKGYFEDDGTIKNLSKDEIRNLNNLMTTIGKGLDQEAFKINMASMQDKLRGESQGSENKK